MPRIPSAPPEVVVAMRPNVDLTLTTQGIAADPSVDVRTMNELISQPRTTLQPLYGLSESRMRLKTKSLAKKTGRKPLNLSRFYRLQAPENQLEKLMDQLRNEPAVETVYRKPGAIPAIWHVDNMVPDQTERLPVIPDLSPLQRYLNPVPSGIDALFAWTQAGGKGTHVQIIDIEGGWRFSHQDLDENQRGVLRGENSELSLWLNHGTAVLGIFSGDENDSGIKGICPEATVSGVSIFGSEKNWGMSAAIFFAADCLRKGDILLIELQMPGPVSNFQERDDQLGYIPIEWWPDCFEAIRYATQKGIVVVTAGGNGRQDLGSTILDQGPTDRPFPATWRNPFGRGEHDSGSIIVGAGAPPEVQGFNQDRISNLHRLQFSNFGNIVDAQGWGDLVVTCGFGNMPGLGVDAAAPAENSLYTPDFNGTSSAAPMVAGALGCVQGILKAKGLQPLTPLQARDLLRMEDPLQQDAPVERIGYRPNLKHLVPAAIEIAQRSVPPAPAGQ